jgi:hypothetical protein
MEAMVYGLKGAVAGMSNRDGGSGPISGGGPGLKNLSLSSVEREKGAALGCTLGCKSSLAKSRSLRASASSPVFWKI